MYRLRQTTIAALAAGAFFLPAYAGAGENPPWRIFKPGYEVEIASTGYQLPVAIAFVSEPGSAPEDPLYYVAELYGAIKVVTRDGVVHDFANDLLNFEPTGQLPGNGEQGIGGLAVEPQSGDLLVTLVYLSDPGDVNSPLFPRVIRIASEENGLVAGTITTVLDMPGEQQFEAHQIGAINFGPDGLLFVHNGDGFFPKTALDLDSFRGKILRFDLAGEPAVNNPFHDLSDGITATDYIFSHGHRNPFGGNARWADNTYFAVENGPVTDRFALITPGVSYGWDGSDNDMLINAVYNWFPAHAPVHMAITQEEVFSRSGFPPEAEGRIFVTESGQHYRDGPGPRGKRISFFDVTTDGGLIQGPCPLAGYAGTGKATAVALAAGPDGLYFSDFYKDQGSTSPVDRGSNVLRVKWVGTADFVTGLRVGDAPFSTTFSDVSHPGEANSREWNFGDGETGEGRQVTHTYTAPGVYDVSLTVETEDGPFSVVKRGHIVVGPLQGLHATYHAGIGLCCPQLSRVDPIVDFNWLSGSPDPEIEQDYFAARWSGMLEPILEGEHEFIVRSDDGARLWINGHAVIDQWENQSPTTVSGSIGLQADQPVPIILEYYDYGGGAEVSLSWRQPSGVQEIIPSDRLKPVPLQSLTNDWLMIE